MWHGHAQVFSGMEHIEVKALHLLRAVCEVTWPEKAPPLFCESNAPSAGQACKPSGRVQNTSGIGITFQIDATGGDHTQCVAYGPYAQPHGLETSRGFSDPSGPETDSYSACVDGGVGRIGHVLLHSRDGLIVLGRDDYAIEAVRWADLLNWPRSILSLGVFGIAGAQVQ